MEREDRRNARFVDQVKSLQAALIEAAPILRPLADLDSLLREHQQPASNDLGSLRLSSSILRHCAELFSDSSVDDQWLDLARTMTNGVCSFCYEYLEDDDYEEACLVPDYEFDYENQLIILKHLRIGCPLCREISSLSILMPICGRAVASGSVASKISLPSSSKLCSEFPALAEKVNSYLNQFIEVNELDPGSQSGNFQLALSISFSLLILSKEFKWSLKSPKSSFRELFVETITDQMYQSSD